MSEHENEEHPEIVEEMRLGLVVDASLALHQLRERNPGINDVDLVNRAVQVYNTIDAELDAKNKIFSMTPNGQTYRLKFNGR